MACNPQSLYVSGICLDKFGCDPHGTSDFCIKRHDTMPPFKVKINDCDGPMDLTGLILEVNMWARAKIKKAITYSETYIALSDNIGFDQCKQGDIIVVDQVRAPEQMLVMGFDEDNKFILVKRGYAGTIARNYKRGTGLRIMRVLNAPASTEMDKEDIPQVDGTTKKDVLVESRLVYEWQPNDTCLPGCYLLEFKLLKMTAVTPVAVMGLAPSVTPSFISYTEDQMGCELGAGVEWVRRFPVTGEGFVIKVNDSPTAENLM